MFEHNSYKTENDKSFKLDLNKPPNISLEKVGGFLYQNGTIIIHVAKGIYKAFSYACTHYGCIIGYDKNYDILVCPCKCGAYDLEGNVIEGIPVKPLRQFMV